MARANGLSVEFNKGRDYEQQEVLMMLTDLLHIAEDELVRDLLTAWQQEIIDRLIANQSQLLVVVEETYLMELEV